MKAVEDAMPLAERMRPVSLDHVYGQELVGPGGVLRGMVDEGKLPSMVLWGRPGTGKTTIARLIANMSGARFVEINSTSTKLEEVRKIFAEAARDLHLSGRKRSSSAMSCIASPRRSKMPSLAQLSREL